ncbi:MBL fold metallo-hydrolase [Aquabacterium sp. A08]|uniref:MBL fold metallo-hydrolase n=1 Tax=Aquabacterium sp. A08 TaxID=2718532 RepID=UPI00141EF315|nr:3',5'-cyclic-nucleotide phosphodiesterase [Aquabacterium sp. A08]NIC41584.1 3',5'-cyclic-nucleotide phosphodiesterase [Aquabacterium sp. A08]
MQVQILGCSGAIAQHARTTAFLIDDRILVDAGTGVGDLTVEAMLRIEHVFLTHAHLDHVAALPLMLDAVASGLTRPLVVHALPETIAALQRHVFNGTIWPDFSAIPSPQAPFLVFEPLRVGAVVEAAGHRVEALPAAHTVPAVGYAVDTPAGHWVFSGDTGGHPAFWARVNQLRLAMLVIETAFSERELELALRSQHLCPSLLAEELQHLDRARHPNLRIAITHTKPMERELIAAEVAQMGLDTAHPLLWLEAGQVFDLSAPVQPR